MATARPYHSTIRQRHAEATRQKVLLAARNLMTKKGFDGATIEAIAHDAGVSVQTVYGIFGSKKGIMAELLERASFGPAYQEAIKRAKETSDPADRLRGVAAIARQVLDSERSELELLRGVATVSPELAAIERAREGERYEHQARTVELVAASGRLRAGLDEKTARDIVWTLTGRETFRMLVIERKWPASRYQGWLGELLIAALLEPEPPRERPRTRRR
jgi:AcrR family transcriptional regulator